MSTLHNYIKEILISSVYKTKAGNQPIIKYIIDTLHPTTILMPPCEIRPINMCNTTIYLSRGFDPLHKTQEAQDPRKQETQGQLVLRLTHVIDPAAQTQELITARENSKLRFIAQCGFRRERPSVYVYSIVNLEINCF